LNSPLPDSPEGDKIRRFLRTLGLLDPSGLGFIGSPGRVSIVHGVTAEVIWADEDGEETTSTCQFATNLNLSPVAGDWVSVRDGYITDVCDRRTTLRRPRPRGREMQSLAANVDVVLVVVPIDRELNLLMLERLAVMAWDSGARPVVVLSKADGTTSVDEVVEATRLAVPGVDVLTTSSLSGHGIKGLRDILGEGVTAVMLGASGAGKTSLLNALEGTNETTRSVSRGGEGRHATTTRRLYRLSSGGVLLDIPGIRLLDLTVGQAGFDEAFADIVELAGECRFRDCAHQGDEGCAVETAVREGRLPARRLESWRRINADITTRQRADDESASRGDAGPGTRRSRRRRGG
jgi:ribosome biogenesis GTPase